MQRQVPAPFVDLFAARFNNCRARATRLYYPAAYAGHIRFGQFILRRAGPCWRSSLVRDVGGGRMRTGGQGLCRAGVHASPVNIWRNSSLSLVLPQAAAGCGRRAAFHARTCACPPSLPITTCLLLLPALRTTCSTTVLPYGTQTLRHTVRASAVSSEGRGGRGARLRAGFDAAANKRLAWHQNAATNAPPA